MKKQVIKLMAALFIMLMANQVLAADKRIGILVYDGVLTSDVTAPMEVFGVATRKSWFTDYETVVISVENQPSITTEEGLIIAANSWIGEHQDLDVLVVPSSYDMKPLINNKKLIEFIRQAGAQTQWMASNCSGALLLAEAGILDGKKATTWAGGEKEFQDSYAKVDVQFDQNVVVDKNVITSNGSLVSYQAALTLLAKISSPSKSQEVADALQYARFSQQTFIQ